MNMEFYAPFALPFMVGVVVLFSTLAYKYTKWIVGLSSNDKRLIGKGLFSWATIEALCETISEALLHRRIFRVNPLLGYMHASLAFGWFLLICVGFMETMAVLPGQFVMPQGHIFFRYFSAQMGLEENHTFAFLMDLLLAIILSGVLLAYAKRLSKRIMGMRKTTRHTLGDRLALTSLWLVFPMRLLAESFTCAIYGGGSFLTGSLGEWMGGVFSAQVLLVGFDLTWWTYSISLGVFFIAMPFSRYMHILTEVPLIFLRRYKLRSSEKESSFDNFQVEACSRCGICLDPCQLQDVLGINDVQSVYFLRDRREQRLKLSIANNCLMCGRCSEKCPVGIDLNTLRLNSREKMSVDTDSAKRYNYIAGQDKSSGEGRVGYFAGCMTLLTPRTLHSMEQIFSAAGVDVWWADRDGGVCCGRPLHLSGEVDAALKMMRYNEELFKEHNITTLVTSCPICLKVFKEKYQLEGIELLHHSEYIDRLIKSGAIKVHSTSECFTYHDPCELGRGLKIYDEPRSVIQAVGQLRESSHSRENSLCCGASLANTVINDKQQAQIASRVTAELTMTEAKTIVTACPLCKKSLARTTQTQVKDLSEVVAEQLS